MFNDTYRRMLAVLILVFTMLMVLSGSASHAQQEPLTTTLSSEEELCPRLGIRHSLVVEDGTPTAHVRNVLDQDCTVSLAAYKMYIPYPEPGWLATQKLYKAETVVLPARGRAILTLDPPDCMAQVDLMLGDPITDFSVGPFQGQILAGTILDLPVCEDPIAIRLEKTNDANQDGVFSDAEIAQPGATVQFQLKITNPTDQAVTLVSIQDDIYELAGSQCETLEGKILPAGSAVICTFTGVIPNQYSLQEVNTATVVVENMAGEQATAADTSTVTTPDNGGAATPAVQVTKSLVTEGAAADGIVKVGQLVTFTISIQNTGETDLKTVPLRDIYNPLYLSYVDASPAPDESDTPGLLVWSNLLAVGEVLAPQAFITPEVVVTFQAIGSTQALLPDQQTTNQAVVANAVDVNNTTAQPDEDEAPVRLTNPAVSIGKRVTDPATGVVTANGEVTFTLTIANIGDTKLVQIPVYDLYDPAELLYVRTGLTTAPAVDEESGELVWADVTEDPQVGDLAPGDSASFTVTFRYIGAPGATATNVAFLNEEEVIDEFGDTTNPVQGQASATVTSAPTAIALLRFSAVRESDGVHITWITGAELNSWGFHLWRGETTDWQQAVRITKSIYPAQGGTGTGATYRYLDTAAGATQPLFYWLQELEVDGAATLYGPFTLSTSSPGAGGNDLYLPQIRQ